MKAIPLLRRELVVVPLEAGTIVEALNVLTAQLDQAGLLTQADMVARAIAQHAARAAVRVGPDIVLPHYRTDAVGSVVVSLGVARSPLRTDEPEWSPGPRIIALVLAPTDATTSYLQTVSALARVLKQPEILGKVLAANDTDAIFDVPALSALEIRPKLTVRDVMAPVDNPIKPEVTVRAAVEMMLRSGVRALVVVGDKGEVLGMVSEADVMRGLVLNRSRPAEDAVLPPLKVRDVMSRSVMCTADRAALDEVANLMINKDVEEVPVVAEGRLTGIVRRGDILRTLYGR